MKPFNKKMKQFNGMSKKNRMNKVKQLNDQNKQLNT